jgi:hypothetical protein
VAHVFQGFQNRDALRVNDGFFRSDNNFGFHVRTWELSRKKIEATEWRIFPQWASSFSRVDNYSRWLLLNSQLAGKKLSVHSFASNPDIQPLGTEPANFISGQGKNHAHLKRRTTALIARRPQRLARG